MRNIRNYAIPASKAMLKLLAAAYPFLLMSLVAVAAVETINRGQLGGMFKWCVDHPDEVWLNAAAALGLYAAAAALLGRTAWAYGIVTAVLLAVSAASGVKWHRTGTPLYLWDMVLPTETKDVVASYTDAWGSQLLPAIAVSAAIVAALLLWAPRFRAKAGWKTRAGLGVLSLVLLISLISDKPFAVKRHFGIFTIGWDQADNYLYNGYLLSTAMAVNLVRMEKPAGYSPDRIDGLVDGVKKRADIDKSVNPNIIVLLSESYWDPTQLKDVTFSEDPIPFFHSLQQTSTSGLMLSPQFGGTTANVEFEVLTGNSVRFLPPESIAYIEYVNHGIDSLASILARQGYATTAINPFYNCFFNSRNVYQSFGFSRFISSEFFNPVYHGPYLEDDAVVSKIIEESVMSKGPDFIFANTMENHGPYKDKFNYNPIRVDGPITEESKNILENYATGINANDKALKRLVEHFAASKEPTILLYFGDHLPGLGDDYKTYKDAKYISGNNDPDFLAKMYSTPVVVWNNYLPPKKEQLHLSPSFLGPYLLNLAKKEGTYYTDYLYGLSQKIPIIPPEAYYGDMKIDARELQEYRQLEYDIVAGGRFGYARAGIRDRILDPAFELGYGTPVIDSVDLGTGRLVVRGERFEHSHEIYLDGRRLDTSWTGEGTLTARLPAGYQAQRGIVQVKLKDYKHTVISRSELFSFNRQATR